MSVHVIGVILVLAAFFLFGKGIVQRSRGKSFRPLPVFLLMVAAIAVHFIMGEGGFSSRIGSLFLDFGVGMIIASTYLSRHRHHPKMFWVPGALAMIVGASALGFSYFKSWCHQDFRNRPTTIELLVELGPDDDIKEINYILKEYGAEAEKAFPNVSLADDEDLAQYYVIFVDSAKMQPMMMDLKQDTENVDQVDRNHPVYAIQPTQAEVTKKSPIKFIANDPFLEKQWYASSLAYNEVHNFLSKHKPVKKAKVAIVDTGVDQDHEDIAGVYQKSGGSGDYDKHSHGTHCAGLAGAATNNGIGVGSMNWAGEFVTLSGYPALDDQGRGTDKRVAQAIIDAANGGADVISMSLGGFSPFGAPKAQVDAIKYARNKGAIVVVAAGNSNDDARRYSPANIKGVITVSAIGEDLRKASFSNTNAKLKMPIAAPGVNILSSVPGSQYQSYNGTSMATPIVSGLVGILRAYNPDLTTEQAYQIINKTGTDGQDTKKVGRIINPLPAIHQAIQMK
ncbi:S8 family serine peptidase [Pontibacter sp. G13]|uniref:S8 family peptidase n=1 Tax=Pontibacter sp. G13 TaxID=3074898 RepID=UPI00288C148E|nr:S8 family serine peptidase [Pontibacter sp. G13]WNJ20526.1 S8 family serine peptidase [Pontibacter sp. G13]